MSNLLGSNSFSVAGFSGSQSVFVDRCPTVLQILDNNGEFSIPLANANTYELVAATFKGDPTGQASGYRIDVNNTTHLKGRMNLGVDASGLTVAVTYKLI